MKLLAIDTSGQVASAALLSEGKLLCELTLNFNMTHSQTIMPLIDGVMGQASFKLKDLDYIACASGPGSFTGLRIGAATAKGLALGAGLPVIPVPTLDSLAYNIFDTNKIICPIMDARRQQVYTAFYQWEQGEMRRISEYCAQEMDTVIEQAQKKEQGVIFLGDGAVVYQQKLIQQKNFVIAPANCCLQRAASVGALAQILAKEGKGISGREFVPFYLRKSQAERELEEKNTALGRNEDA